MYDLTRQNSKVEYEGRAARLRVAPHDRVSRTTITIYSPHRSAPISRQFPGIESRGGLGFRTV